MMASYGLTEGQPLYEMIRKMRITMTSSEQPMPVSEITEALGNDDLRHTFSDVQGKNRPITADLRPNIPGSSLELDDSQVHRTNPLSLSIGVVGAHSSELLSTHLENETCTEKRELYRYKAEWPISSLACSTSTGERLTVALSSFIERHQNYVEIVSLARDDLDQEIRHVTTFNHPYPATKVLWRPQSDNYCNATQTFQSSGNCSLIATSADHLRIWRVQEQPNERPESTNGSLADTSIDLKPECTLNYSQGLDQGAPLTSFAWNDIDPRLIATASLDTTCAIWDLEYEKVIVNYAGHRSPSIEVNVNPHVAGTLVARLVAHDHHVYDVTFSRLGSGRDIIISCGGDRSVRMSDLRQLGSSSVLFESLHASGTALVRVDCSKWNVNLISTFAIDSNEIMILDIRMPTLPLYALDSHQDYVNCMSWAPNSPVHLCSGSEDGQAVIWDLSNLRDSKSEPLLAYHAEGRINSISWSEAHDDWIAISHGGLLELLRV